MDRKSVVVALGGGVVGDMAGFAASTYMRGISFVQVPTTLLAQVDSSVGGKTGVDFNGNKNMIGAFYQPDFVFINSETLKTLPYREVAAGIAEAIKYGYIIDKDFLEYCVENKGSIKSLDNNALIEVIYKCCEAKAYVVSKDEKELGLRAILNFGHTFGHSVETLNNFKLLHGECVAIGMVAALYYSMECGNTTKEDIENIEKTVNEVIARHLPVTTEFITQEEAVGRFDLKRLPDNASDTVRIVRVGDYDECLCIGLHVTNTSEIGTFRIISSDYKDGIFRIRFKLA